MRVELGYSEGRVGVKKVEWGYSEGRVGYSEDRV